MIAPVASAQPLPSATDLKRPSRPAGTCPARVGLAGDSAAIAKVGTELTSLGVEVGAPVAGCRSISARVEVDDGGGIAVAIVDGARRSEGRVVADAVVAAMWIDTWLRDDLDGAGWLVAIPQARPVTPDPSARRVAAAGPPGLADPPIPADTGAARRGTALIDRFAISVGYEQSWTDDGIAASGLTVAACVRVGGVCIGARGRHAADPERSLDYTAMARSDSEVLAIATTSFSMGRMTIAPEVGVGFGWRQTARVDCTPVPQPEPPPPNCMDPMDPNCNPGGMVPPDGSAPGASCADPGTSSMKVYVGDGLEARTYTPRLSAGVRLAVPLFDRVWLEGSASASLAPFGHAGLIGYTGTMMTDPTTGLTPDQFALPGEPSASFRLSVGIRVGAR